MKKTFKNEAKFVRAMRDKAGVSQGYVAKKLGIKLAQYLSNIERGVCAMSPEYLKKYAQLCGHNPELHINAKVLDHKESLRRYL